MTPRYAKGYPSTNARGGAREPVNSRRSQPAVHILPGDMDPDPEGSAIGCAGECEACEYRQGSVECMLTVPRYAEDGYSGTAYE